MTIRRYLLTLWRAIRGVPLQTYAEFDVLRPYADLLTQTKELLDDMPMMMEAPIGTPIRTSIPPGAWRKLDGT